VSIADAGSRQPGPFWSLLKEELAPRPHRLAASLRTAACCAVVVVVALIFENPLPAYAAYIVLLITGEDVVVTSLGGLIGALGATVAVGLALLCYAFDAGEPALRVPVIALTTVAGMYAARALKIGPAAFLAAFLFVMGQTLIDQFATTEAVVRLVLWLWVVVTLPVAVTILGQLALGERPAARARRSALSLLRALADALRNPRRGSLRARHAEAVKLVESTRRAAMIDSAVKGRFDSDAHLIETLATLLAMQEVLPAETPAALREPLADACEVCADVFERGDAVAPPAEAIVSDASLDQAPPQARPVAYAIAAALERLREGLNRRNRGVAEPDRKGRRPPLAPARDRADARRFALKSALAVMSAYVIYTALAWPEISTAVTTCFFVSLGSLGESVHKLLLRLGGALLGGLAAGLCITFVLPSMTDIGHLCVLIGAAAGISAWVASSSERLSYMGMQMGFAFFLGILQGPRPPTEYTVLRDRVIGIVLGNVLVTVIFSTLWPTSAKARAGAMTDQALAELAAFMGAGAGDEAGPRLAVLGLVEQARRLDSFAAFELRMIPGGGTARPRQDRLSVDALERLAGLAFVAAEPRVSAATADRLRSGHEEASRLLRALAHGSPPGIAAPADDGKPLAPAGAVEGASLSDRAAIEANALLLSELEKTHALTT